VGEDGYAALLARAAMTTTSDESVLTVIPRSDAMSIDIDIATAVETHGVRAVGASLESLLAALVDILSDLIGEDMARNAPRSRWLTSQTGWTGTTMTASDG
jgi:hypothetical protein